VLASILAPQRIDKDPAKEIQMKRPVSLLIIATLLASTSAMAAGETNKERFAERVMEKSKRAEARRDDRRHDDRRDHDRGGDHRRDDNRRDDHRRDNDRRDNDRRDWNDHRDNDRRDHDRRDNDRRDYRHDNRHDNRGWDRHRNDWDRHPNYWDNRRHDRRDHARYRYNYGHYHQPRGYYYRSWHRGDRLPSHWYSRQYVVYDWRPYRLYSPPYGYHWVRVGNDVVLTAIATGLVLDVLYDIWY
jgi:Ni/Co efflux regulator RcnB